MCPFSSPTPTSWRPSAPAGTCLEAKACSVTIHTYPDPVMFSFAASWKIWSASSVLKIGTRTVSHVTVFFL